MANKYLMYSKVLVLNIPLLNMILQHNIKIYLLKTTSTQVIKRTMRSSRQVGSAIYNGATKKSHSIFDYKCNYSTYKIQTPDPTKSSLESLNQNPIITLYRKKGAKVIQHAEVLEISCDQPGCSGKLCLGLCGVPKGTPKVIGHVSHSQEHGTATIGDTDIEGQEKEQYFTRYSKPYKSTEENSSNPVVDEERTKKFLALLKKIEDDTKDKN